MDSTRTPQQTISALRAGPNSKANPITAAEVTAAAEKLPKSYLGAMSAVLYKLADTQLKAPGKNAVKGFEYFTEPWLRDLTDDRARYLAGYLDAFSAAVDAGLSDLQWKNPELAQHIVDQLRPQAPEIASVEGLAWLPMIGQLQSTYSRDDAAATFKRARAHDNTALIADFYWDTGALTYYSEAEVQQRRTKVPPLLQGASNQEASNDAIVISVDPNFFRIYGPMILFNAQQLPEVDFVIVLCASDDDAQHLIDDANNYVAALSKFNKQLEPSNVRINAVDVPQWVSTDRTFYACARFLVLPELLDQYETIYAMDADLFITKDPKPFISAAPKVTLSVPETQGLLGVPPWRRYMAGNMIVHRKTNGSNVLSRLINYLSVGLTEQSSWMLDQNAIAYAVEGAEPGEFEKLSKARPSITAPFMRRWERNYQIATR